MWEEFFFADLCRFVFIVYQDVGGGVKLKWWGKRCWVVTNFEFSVYFVVSEVEQCFRRLYGKYGWSYGFRGRFIEGGRVYWWCRQVGDGFVWYIVKVIRRYFCLVLRGLVGREVLFISVEVVRWFYRGGNKSFWWLDECGILVIWGYYLVGRWWWWRQEKYGVSYFILFMSKFY